MKRLIWTLILSLATGFTVLAQSGPKAEGKITETKPAALPTVDEILAKYVGALGGKEAIEKVTSRSARGTMELEGMGINGPLELYAKAPNKTATIIELGGLGKIINVFDGTNGYSADPTNGLRELSGAELATAKRNADFYEPLNLKKHFSKLEVKGKEKIGASEAYVIEAIPDKGDPEKHYFAVDTGLLIRSDSNAETPQGKLAVEMNFGEYKEVGGVKVPHTLRQVTPIFTAVLKLSEVKHNVAIDDAKFAKPTGQ